MYCVYVYRYNSGPASGKFIIQGDNLLLILG